VPVLSLVASLPLRVAVATSASTFVLADAAGFLAYSRAFVPTVVAPLALGAAVGVVTFSFKAYFCLRVWGCTLVGCAGGDCCAWPGVGSVVSWLESAHSRRGKC